MYKAIIADDEETVRRGLVTHFNWGKHGVEVAGVFDDGVPALDFVRRNEVDIIVTDVRMSHMDGITLAKNVLESYPGVKIIFISGYADVGYLRDALKMEAVDYILKSIDIDELDAVITKVVAMLTRGLPSSWPWKTWPESWNKACRCCASAVCAIFCRTMTKVRRTFCKASNSWAFL